MCTDLEDIDYDISDLTSAKKNENSSAKKNENSSPTESGFRRNSSRKSVNRRDSELTIHRENDIVIQGRELLNKFNDEHEIEKHNQEAGEGEKMSMKTKKEDDSVSNQTLQTVESRKKVNFSADNMVIKFEGQKINSNKNFDKSRNKKKIKSILKKPVKEAQEDPFEKLQNLIKECEEEEKEVESQPQKTNTPKANNNHIHRNIKYIDELQKRRNSRNSSTNKQTTKDSIEKQSLEVKKMESDKFENLSPIKKGNLLKTYISNLNIESAGRNLESASKKILEEDFPNISSMNDSNNCVMLRPCSQNTNSSVKEKIKSPNNGLKSNLTKIVKKPPTPLPSSSLNVVKK